MKADIGNWIWLAVIIFGIISKFLKSDTKKPEREEPQEPTATGTTFEELLKEIERQKQQPVPAPTPVKRNEPAKRSEPAKRNESSRTLLDTVIPNYQDDTSKIYNDAIKSAFNYKSLEDTVSLEESLKLSDTKPAYRKFDEYGTAATVSLAARYAQDLRNPQDIKKAIVLSEILSRRF